MEIELDERWDDLGGDYAKYLCVRLSSTDRCCIKKLNDGYMYVMQCANGYEVYTEGSDNGYRNLPEAERHNVMVFAEEQFKAEEMLDAQFKEVVV